MTTTAAIGTTANSQNPSPLTAKPAANSGSNSGGGFSPSTISSNDFLTLLVTEMKNQDPTSATDPNEYVNQLVSVNSLEQLIQINETLAVALFSGTSDSSSAASSTSQPGVGQQLSGAAPITNSATSPSGAPITPGNLGVPPSNPAAHGVATALSGRTHLS